MLRATAPADTPSLIALAASTGLFQPDEVEAFEGVLDELHAGKLGEGHSAQVLFAGDPEVPVGWTYFSPVPMSDRVWQLWWIGVDPTRQGQGFGSELLRAVESHVRAAEGRLLLIETSSLPSYEPTWRFYARHGYIECAHVPDFYADGEAKVIFWKRVGETE